MKLAVTIILGLVVIFIGVQAFKFLTQEHALSQNLSDVETRLSSAQNQEANLEDETKYLSNPANLEKELRSQFNYKKPGETMIVIVPGQTSTSP